MARLGPWVGVKQIEEDERPVGYALQHLQRVAAPQADVGELLVLDVAERRRHPIEERLGADEPMIGQHVGAVGEMLARAEPDLEMERPLLAEQALGGDFALRRHLDLRQQLVDQLLLALAQLVPG